MLHHYLVEFLSTIEIIHNKDYKIKEIWKRIQNGNLGYKYHKSMTILRKI